MKHNPFSKHTSEYENWFKENEKLFQAELQAIQQLLPNNKTGVEIGVGSGLFAEKLKVEFGIDPSEQMLNIATQRNIKLQKGIAEDLPYTNNRFGFTLFVNSICFIDNPPKAIAEAYRVLQTNGDIIIAIIDKNSTLGRTLEKNKHESRFYKHANFFSVEDIIALLENGGFVITKIIQTLIANNTNTVEKAIAGHGKGSFVVIKATKPPANNAQ